MMNKKSGVIIPVTRNSNKKEILLTVNSFIKARAIVATFNDKKSEDYDKFIGEWTTNKSDIILRIYFSKTNNRFDFWQYKEIETLDYYNCKTNYNKREHYIHNS